MKFSFSFKTPNIPAYAINLFTFHKKFKLILNIRIQKYFEYGLYKMFYIC